MRARWILRFAVGLGAVIALTGAEGLDPGELHCEEAAKHLAACCHSNIDLAYSCTAGRGCDEGRPSLDDPRATEVRDSSCESLIAQGACERPPMTYPSFDLSAPRDFATTLDQSAAHDLARPHDLAQTSDGGDM